MSGGIPPSKHFLQRRFLVELLTRSWHARGIPIPPQECEGGAGALEAEQDELKDETTSGAKLCPPRRSARTERGHRPARSAPPAAWG